MKTNKFLKILSIILECSFLGSVILYIYNYYISVKKYEIIPQDAKAILNTFIVIAIISLVFFLIIKYVLYLRNKTNYKENIQIQMDLDDHKEEQLKQTINELEEKCRNLEEPVNERVIIYKDCYDVPKEKRMNCPNCKSIIDKNAFICVKCGYLLKDLHQEKVIEKIIEKPVYIKDEIKHIDVEKSNLKNILVNIGLIIGIIICLILIITTALERGII